MTMDYLLFVRSDQTTRYWDRSNRHWTESLNAATGYKTAVSAQAAKTRMEQAGPIRLPQGEKLLKWGFVRRDHETRSA